MGFLSSVGKVFKSIPIIGDIATAMIGRNEQDRVNSANALQADMNRQFQERMARNAHQYEVEDLKKAGLNPILSAKLGGSATPSGSTATMVASPAMQNLRVGTAKANIDLMKEQSKTEQTKQALNASAMGVHQMDQMLKSIDYYIRKADVPYSDIRKLKGLRQLIIEKMAGNFLSPFRFSAKELKSVIPLPWLSK